MKNCDSSLIFAQNLDCGCTLEAPQRVPSIYVLKQNKKKCILRQTPVLHYKGGV